MAFTCPFCSKQDEKTTQIEQIDPQQVVEHLIIIKMDQGNGESVFHIHGPVESMSAMIELITEAAKEIGLETLIET